jgi:phospholipid-binding lipoprotein MlaA
MKSLICGVLLAVVVAGVPRGRAAETNEAEELPGIGEERAVAASVAVSDPLEPVNRAFFQFNDKLYFWMLQPLSEGYAYVMPATARRGVRNFFRNLATPIRLGNALLQGDGTGAWVECQRFAYNTTAGVAGFGDWAARRRSLAARRADFGQTLGTYGVGASYYIHWPILGPSSVRDSVGYAGDYFLNPLTYLVTDLPPNLGIQAYDTANDLSLRPGEYERFKAAAIDPYLALRDAYYQYRRSLVAGLASCSTNAPVTPTR